ncbi:MAG: HNH endonuclease signature motif containing protein [Blautia sp.]|nr:HNH endonuclease signature motif containing protein [Blautia sp.]
MAKDYARKFYSSTAWIRTQAAYMTSQNYLCERCGDMACIVHHKKHITPQNIDDVNITLNWDNLEALCQNCHNKEHFAKSGSCASGLQFDKDGNLVKV